MTEQGAGVHRSCYLRLTKQGPETPCPPRFIVFSLHHCMRLGKTIDKEGNKINFDFEHTEI